MDIKYIGMDVHKEAIAIAVMNREGRLVMMKIQPAGARICIVLSNWRDQPFSHVRIDAGFKELVGAVGPACHALRNLSSPTSPGWF